MQSWSRQSFQTLFRPNAVLKLQYINPTRTLSSPTTVNMTLLKWDIMQFNYRTPESINGTVSYTKEVKQEEKCQPIVIVISLCNVNTIFPSFGRCFFPKATYNYAYQGATLSSVIRTHGHVDWRSQRSNCQPNLGNCHCNTSKVFKKAGRFSRKVHTQRLEWSLTLLGKYTTNL